MNEVTMTLPGPIESQRVHARRTSGDRAMSSLDRDLMMVRSLANLLDSSFEVRGVRFGLDAVLGLVPVVGDFASMMLGLYPVLIARRHGVGRWTIAHMLGNLGADFLMGSIPIAGDAADVFFKAHLKNLRLLEAALKDKSVVRCAT
jgi:hypothetical protein